MAVKQLGAGEVWDLNSGGRILSLKTGEEKQCYNDTCFSSMVLNYDCVAYSPDGSRIAAGSRDGSVAIWDARSGAEVLRLRGHSAAVTALAFDRSGAHLASGSGDQIAIVWDLRSGKPVNQMTLTASVTSLAFAPDGDRLLIACGNVGHPAKPDSLVTLWEPLSGRTPAFRFQFPAAATRTWAADLSSDGKLAAATSPAGVFVWERRSGKLLGAADATESSEPTAIAFSPDGSRIVCGTVNGGLRIFDNSGREMLALPGRRSALRTVAFSPDGNRIYSSDENEEVRIWETRSEYVPGSADLVSSLREKLFRWKEIDSRIQADGSLEPKLRQAALQLARRRGDDIGQWSRATSDIVRYPGRTAGEYRAALESAEAALKAFPWHPSLLTVAGAALYRNGRYREALNSLERSESLRAFPSRTDLILIAMTHFQLGETAKARQELKAAVPSRSQFGDQTPQYFLDEADALISSAGSRR
jgi:WD40 repeat protein